MNDTLSRHACKWRKCLVVQCFRLKGGEAGIQSNVTIEKMREKRKRVVESDMNNTPAFQRGTVPAQIVLLILQQNEYANRNYAMQLLRGC